jgi:hypothetical protein
MRRTIENVYFRFTTLLLILVDLIIVIVDLALGVNSHYGLKVADFVLSIYFVLEVSARLAVLKPRVFFVRWYNTLDLAVVLSTFIISCVALDGTASEALEALALFTALRAVRVVRIVRVFTEKQNLETGARQLISQNKRR